MKKILTVVFIAALLQLGIASASYAAPPASGGGAQYHKVRYGETLFSIGRRYGVNPYRIADVNGLYNANYIYAGQVLYIPSGHNQGYSDFNRGRSRFDRGRSHSDCGYNGCDRGRSRFDRDHSRSDCGYNGCDRGRNFSRYDNRSNCGWGCNRGRNFSRFNRFDCSYGGCDRSNRHSRPDHSDCNHGCGGNGYSQHGQDDCGYGCDHGQRKSKVVQGYGYDFAGYYYYSNVPTHKRYSYTCGYFYNCF